MTMIIVLAVILCYFAKLAVLRSSYVRVIKVNPILFAAEM